MGILFIFGVVVYKNYIKSNEKQLADMVDRVNKINDEYKNIVEVHAKFMDCFLPEVIEFKKHRIYKEFKNDTTPSKS